MEKIKTVHLVGLGAVGATYASLFHQWNPQSIKIILDEERIPRYQQGTLINGMNYSFDLITPRPGDAPAELIIIAVKGHHLEKTIELIKPLIGKDTLIISLLNGITSEEDLSQAFGRDKVLHGFCVGMDSTRENNATRFTQAGRIVFGEHYPEVKGKGSRVKDFFDEAGIPYTMPQDILREMWWKFMMNVGVNQTSAILGAPYGVFVRIKEARELMASACREILPIAAQEGISLSEEDIEEYFRIFATLSPSGKTSMLQDIEAGRKTEVESFGLAVMNLGKKHGLPTPVNETLYRMIRVLEARALKEV